MNKNVFVETIFTIAKAYNRDDLTKKETVDVWYKFLKGFDDDVFKHSVNSYIMENRNPPTISDLIKSCRKFEHLKEQGVVMKDV